jgi:cytochrome c oxidase cbb3-type subunit 3
MTQQESSQYGHLLEHEYDGIAEYDNPTPGWWHTIFLGSVLFSAFYFFFFTFSPMAWTEEGQLAEAQRREFQKLFAEIGELEADQETILTLMGDPQWMPVAEGIFATNCVSCHASDGRGLVGPNLTDDHYKNVTDIVGLADVIQNGAANGAMPPWGNRLHSNEVVLLAAYVADMRGQFLDGPRGPEGDIIPAWPPKPVE